MEAQSPDHCCGDRRRGGAAVMRLNLWAWFGIGFAIAGLLTFALGERDVGLWFAWFGALVVHAALFSQIQRQRWPTYIAIYALFGVALAATVGVRDASAQTIRVPEASLQYRLRVERASAEFFGLQANPARLAAQLHQESAWRADARSPFAMGLAQFTPDTAAWLPNACPEVGRLDVWDAGQSIRAAECYNRWIRARITGAASECDRWAMTLAGYNGGLGWINRDRKLAATKGADPARWWGHTELYSPRARWAFKENRGYPQRILLLIEPAYLRAGWAGGFTCGA